MKHEYDFSKGIRGMFYNPEVKYSRSIDEPVLVVKINRTYREGMASEELYEIVRGIFGNSTKPGWIKFYMFSVSIRVPS
jgi:hypothetical protein